MKPLLLIVVDELRSSSPFANARVLDGFGYQAKISQSRAKSVRPEKIYFVNSTG